MPAWLVETSGANQGTTHNLDSGTPVTLGRSPENSIVLQNAIASRRHARIWDDNDVWMVEDLGTKNGTLRNGKAITGQERLEDGDEIVVPGMSLRFQTMDATMTVVMAPTSGVSATRSFFFCDLRGFTAFTEQHGDQEAMELVNDYRRIVRAEVARTHGTEVKTEGDSFFVVFESAHRAFDCALGVQKACAEHAVQHPDRPVRVGIGLHVGEPIVEKGDYLGMAVNVAARLAANAQAGEILISDIVRSLLPQQGLPPMTLTEGITLKGIDDPPRIYSVGAPTPAPAGPSSTAS
jgi:class 3 adenylate cyclase